MRCNVVTSRKREQSAVVVILCSADVCSWCSVKSSLGPGWSAAHTYWIHLLDVEPAFPRRICMDTRYSGFSLPSFSKWEVKYART